jgi:hypothetical protein
MKRALCAYHRGMNETPKSNSAAHLNAGSSHERHRASMAAKEKAKQERLKAALRANLRRRKAADHGDSAAGD